MSERVETMLARCGVLQRVYQRLEFKHFVVCLVFARFADSSVHLHSLERESRASRGLCMHIANPKTEGQRSTLWPANSILWVAFGPCLPGMSESA